MGSSSVTDYVDARLSLNGRAVLCGHCGCELAQVIRPGEADYERAVQLFGNEYPLFRLSHFVLDKKDNLFRITDRGRTRKAEGRKFGHHSAYAGGVVGSLGAAVISWNNPRQGGPIRVVCPRTGLAGNPCGRVNEVNRELGELQFAERSAKVLLLAG